MRTDHPPDPAHATNLQQITTNLERLRAGSGASPERDSQRRSVLIALAQNNCGPQYAAAARNQGSFFDDLFGNHSDNPTILPPVNSGAQSGTYRTVCVRSCDGFYFPISFATTSSRFPDDERTCKNLCPAADAALYAYRNPGEDMNQAVSTSGQPYSSSPNAFRYRQEFNPSCSCKAAGQTWAEALKGLDDKAAAAQQGDIIVTEDGARKISQPTGDKGSQKKNSAAKADAPQTSPTDTAPTASTPSNKPIRSVGQRSYPRIRADENWMAVSAAILLILFRLSLILSETGFPLRGPARVGSCSDFSRHPSKASAETVPDRETSILIRRRQWRCRNRETDW